MIWIKLKCGADLLFLTYRKNGGNIIALRMTCCGDGHPPDRFCVVRNAVPLGAAIFIFLVTVVEAKAFSLNQTNVRLACSFSR